MAIQLRRGQYERFDPTKLLPGELAVVLSGDPGSVNGMSIYCCFAAGTVKRLVTLEDVSGIIFSMTEDIANQFTADVQQATTDANDAAASASESANAASTAASEATGAAADARAAADEARGAVDPDMRLYMKWIEDDEGDQILAVVDTQN